MQNILDDKTLALAKSIINREGALNWRSNLPAVLSAGVGGITGALSADEDHVGSALLGAGAGFGLSKGIGLAARGLSSNLAESIGKQIKPTSAPGRFNVVGQAKDIAGDVAEMAIRGTGEAAAIRGQYMAVPAAAAVGTFLGNEIFTPNYGKKQYLENQALKEELMALLEANKQDPYLALQSQPEQEKISKKVNHVESRRKERAPHLSKSKINKLRDSIKKKQKKIPKGTHHVRLNNASAVVKDVGKKHVVATILGPKMSPPGKNISPLLLSSGVS